MLKRRMLWITVLSCLAFTITGCEVTSKKRNIICLIDFSSSKNDETRQQFYKKVAKENIIKNLAMTDRIVILPLDAASVTNGEEILVKDISKQDFTPDMAPPMEEDKITNDNFDKYKQEITKEFEESFEKTAVNRKPNSRGTDIFGLLNVLSKYIKSETDNRLIFLSDMMNYSDTLKMEPSNKNFNESNLEKVISEVPQVNLKDTKVLVLTGDQPDLSPAHFNLVRSFWTKYFERNSAQLIDFSSAAVSRIEEMLKNEKK